VKKHYYNEFEPYAAQWLRNLIAAGHIPGGEVDERSIADVRPDELAGFVQCHFFAGIGGWPLAARLAGWPEDRELWTGSAPCQPFSVAGKQRGADDERHLWPEFFRLIDQRKPATVMGEQVAAAVGKDWLDGVLANLEGIGYACGAAIVPACAVNAPHRRDRLWFVADADAAERRSDMAERHEPDWRAPGWDEGDGDAAERGAIALVHTERAGLEGFAEHGADASGWPQPDRPTAARGSGGNVADCAMQGEGRRGVCRPGEGARADGERASSELAGCGESAWAAHDWIIGHDGKARRIPVAESGICLLANGVPARVGKLRAYGNAIVPQVAAEVIAAFMECRP